MATGQSVSNTCSIEGGWDRTAMTTQNGKTFVRVINPSDTRINASTTSYGSINNWYSVNSSTNGFT